MCDFNFRRAFSLSGFANMSTPKNYYSAGVQIKFKFSAERKQSAIPLSKS